jgi:hypothetical protein
MNWLFVFILVMAAFLVVVGFMDQQKLHRRRAGWQYKDPEAVELSDSAVVLGRVFAFLGAGFLVALAFGLRAEYTYNQAEVRSAANSAAAELSRGAIGDDFILAPQKPIRDALKAGGHGPKVKLQGPVGSRGYRYEITNINGDHPVCLTATFDAAGPNGPQLKSTVTDGRCDRVAAGQRHLPQDGAKEDDRKWRSGSPKAAVRIDWSEAERAAGRRPVTC